MITLLPRKSISKCIRQKLNIYLIDLQLTKKIQKYKRNIKIENTYLSNALKNSRETRPVGKFFTRIVIAFISWECLSSSETPSWGVISPTIHSVK